MIPPLTPAERDAILRQDFLAFAQAAFVELNPGKVFELSFHHEGIAEALQASINKKTKLVINAPPRSLKSFLASVAWPAFVLGQKPSFKFLCVSYSQDLARDHAAMCRRLMESLFYQRLFRTKLQKITEDEIRTTVGGARLTTSVGATLTGYGGDMIIVDDPMNANDAFSESARRRLNNWFSGTLMSRIDDKRAGAIIVVAQRLHQDDITGHLLERGGWDRLSFPAIAPHDIHYQVGPWDYSWQAGQPLQYRESLEVLEEIRRDLGPFAFSAQYLQEPVPEAGNMIKRDWLRYVDALDVRRPGDQVVQSWDTAIKATETSNYSVCLTFQVRNQNEYRLIGIWRQKVEFPALRAAVSSEATKHRPDAILIEDHATGSPLADQCKSDGMGGIIRRRPISDKRTRLYAETAKIEAGQLILAKSLPGLDEFVSELLSFPGGKYDDQVDALSQFLSWRTETEARSCFSVDWGTCGGQPPAMASQLGAPSPEEMFFLLR